MPAEVVLITGGTGLIGTALCTSLMQQGYQVIVLTRDKSRYTDKPGLQYANWDIKKEFIEENIIGRVDYIIHLAGAGIADKRWTSERKKAIIESRVNSSNLLITYLGKVANHVKAFISASAIGWYGTDEKHAPGKVFKETDPPDESFLGEACRLWESSVDAVSALGIRLVKLRTGIVLSGDGGAIKKFMIPVRFGIAGILGNGKQICSWIHIQDLISMYIFALQQQTISGVYNAVAPHPVSNKELMMKLAHQVKGNFFVPVFIPAFLLRLLVGEMSIEVLKSTSVSAEKIRKEGFSFEYPYISAAVKHL